LCVLLLRQRSDAWHEQSSVQDKLCSKHTQLLLHTDFPLHVHTKSWRKSEDIWPSNKTDSRLNFPSFQPYWRGDPITALASCAFIQIFVCKELFNTCFLNVASPSDFLQDLVCTCKGKSVCSRSCVCFEHNLSCTELCSCQASDLCRNSNTHKRDLEDEES
jgi:hypothetical protein